MTAKELRKARASIGFSQVQFASYLGISVRTLQGWEQGRRKMGTPESEFVKLLLLLKD